MSHAGNVIPEWMETAEDRRERLERELLIQRRREKLLKEAKKKTETMCLSLINQIVDGVAQKCYMKEIFVRDKSIAAAAAEAAVLRRFQHGLTENQHQNVHGGPVMHRWTPDQVPRQDELEDVIMKRKVQGTWVEKARKHVNVSLGGGLTAIVKNPKKVFDEVRYVGDGQANGYVDLQSERGPSRKDLRVGQRVTLDEISLQRRRTYKLGDKTGVEQLNQQGVPLDAARDACSGVIINTSKDFKIQTGLKYLPGQKITNYVCYPGGGSWIRWDATKEVTYEWTDRIVPVAHQQGNTLEDIQTRQDLILNCQWDSLDENVERFWPDVPRIFEGIKDKETLDRKATEVMQHKIEY